MATDNARDASGLVAAFLNRDTWAVAKLRELSDQDGWDVAEALARFVADALRPLQEYQRETVVAAIAAPDRWADYGP